MKFPTRILICFVVVLGLPSAARQSNGGDTHLERAGFFFPSTGIEVSKEAVLLAIDDHSLPLKRKLCYYLSKPAVRRAPVLGPSQDDPRAPDHLAAHFYGTVLEDNGKFRMWYYAVSRGKNGDDFAQGPVCYAESADGISWQKPVLRQVEYQGSDDNNALALPEATIEGVNVIKDEGDPDARRLYKMVYNPFHNGKFTIRTATSPDGIHWTASDSYPLDEFFEQASFFKYNGLYVIHGQAVEYGEGGGQRGRQGYAWVSPDFVTWLPAIAEAFSLPEPSNAEERGLLKPYDQVHLGVGGASRGNVAVGLYGLWHNAPPKQPGRNVPNNWFGYETISCDLGLVVSHDGLHFREPVKGHVYLSRGESPVTAKNGKSYPTILIQSNGILNVGDETRIYHGRWRNAEIDGYWGEVALATLPRDRWGALGLYPDHAEGEVWTAPITLPKEGCKIYLNADAAGAMRIEVADADFQLRPDFSGEKSGTTKLSAGLDCPVDWPAGDLSPLGGQTIRLRVHMKRAEDSQPRLYAVYLRDAK